MPGTEREVRIPMADGVLLAATLYLPEEADGPSPGPATRRRCTPGCWTGWPQLLMRQSAGI